MKSGMLSATTARMKGQEGERSLTTTVLIDYRSLVIFPGSFLVVTNKMTVPNTNIIKADNTVAASFLLGVGRVQI